MSGTSGKNPSVADADEELKQYEPIYSAPPEKPEYYMLWKKKGARELTGLKINSRIVEDKARLERHETLSRLRREDYARRFPDKIFPDGSINDPLMINAGVTIPAQYMPAFDVYKNDIPPKEPIVLVHIPVPSVPRVHTVSPEWKDIIEEVAPGECQFFPFEFRHKDGTLIRTRYIIRCLAPEGGMRFSPKKSGFKRERKINGPRAGEYYWDTGGFHGRPGIPQKLYAGQLVLCRSAVAGWNIIYRDSYYFVSARLYERLKEHCGRHYAFYPLHIDEEC